MRKFEIIYHKADLEHGGNGREEILADKCNVMQSGVIVFSIRQDIIKVLSSSGFVSIRVGETIEETSGRSIELQ